VIRCASTLLGVSIALAGAQPEDAVSAILAAFETHSVVALGEGPHGNEEGHAFRLASNDVSSSGSAVC
jgi:hypothetical protein